MVLASSTRRISCTRWGGVRASTECTERSSADHTSLWKLMMMLAAGRSESYVRPRHLGPRAVAGDV